METIRKWLAVIAMIVLIGTIARDVYVRWIEPRGSVLDKYREPVEDQIAKAGSLEELVRLFEPAHAKVEQAEKEEREKGAKDQDDYRKHGREPYKSEQQLRSAIQTWESQAREIYRLRVYWDVGFALVGIGVILTRRKMPWPGLALLVVGFSEAIYWTTPTYFGSSPEFDRLLVNQIVLLALSLALLVAVVWLLGIFRTGQKNSEGGVAAR